MSWTIVATYGNACPYTRWASGIRSIEDAESLRERAINMGFRDATIWKESDFRAFIQSRLRGEADKGRPRREGGKV
jgi:tRNA(Phe) wybutosine-synthesizing methylase Tyw3